MRWKLRSDNCSQSQSNQRTFILKFVYIPVLLHLAHDLRVWTRFQKNKNQNVRGWRWGRREILVCLRVNPKSWNTSSQNVLGQFFRQFMQTRNRLFQEFLVTIKDQGTGNLFITLFCNFFRRQSEFKSTKTKMKFLIVFALCLVAAMAAPPTGDVTLLKNDFANDGTAGYNFA